MTATETEMFEYLDDLRESGITNMYGAPAYLEREFDLNREESVAVWKKWADTFCERHGIKETPS